jgi:hypothetical protein
LEKEFYIFVKVIRIVTCFKELLEMLSNRHIAREREWSSKPRWGVHAIAHACIEMQRPARFFARMHEMRSKSHAWLRASSYLSLESLTFLLATFVALHPRTH